MLQVLRRLVCGPQGGAITAGISSCISRAPLPCLQALLPLPAKLYNQKMLARTFMTITSPVSQISKCSVKQSHGRFPLPYKNTGMLLVRGLNRNARRPKKANHGKRPVSHARKRAKAKTLKSRLHREKVFGFY